MTRLFVPDRDPLWAQPGKPVRVRGSRTRAFVKSVISDVAGGRILDREILGFRCWNVEDLRPARTVRS